MVGYTAVRKPTVPVTSLSWQNKLIEQKKYIVTITS